VKVSCQSSQREIGHLAQASQVNFGVNGDCIWKAMPQVIREGLPVRATRNCEALAEKVLGALSNSGAGRSTIE